MIPEKLLDEVDMVMSWASDVAELWTSTLFEDQIEMKQSQLKKALENQNYEPVEELVDDLSELLHYAEEEYDVTD